MSEQPTTPMAEPVPPGRPPLVRRAEDRAIAGVGAAVARHLGIDPIIVRVVLVALAFAGGAGVLAYIAGWLLIPAEEGGVVRERGSVATIAGTVAVVAAVAWAMPDWIGPGFGGLLWLSAVAAAGAALWLWSRDSERPGLRRAGLWLVVLGVAGVLAVVSFWVAAFGGVTAVGIAVVAAGLTVAALAAFGRSAWPVLPLAIAAALPAALVAAAGIEFAGGVGERSYRPATLADVADRYEVGAGELLVDLRDVDFAGARRTVTIDIGLGEARVLVPADVCVTGRADIGAGTAEFLDRDVEGVDVAWADDRTAKAGAGTLVVIADIGLGAIDIDTEDDGRADHGPWHNTDDDGPWHDADDDGPWHDADDDHGRIVPSGCRS